MDSSAPFPLHGSLKPNLIIFDPHEAKAIHLDTVLVPKET